MANAQKDGNSVAVAMGVSDIDGVTMLPFTINHSTGRLMLTAIISGGLSSYMLTPTETPNGVLTVFTLASALAQPSFIISDNAIMQATTKAGTVNWTWNAGAKQVTMTIPPQDDILGLI